MHFRFIGVPAPTAVFLDRNVAGWIEAEPPQSFMAGAVYAIGVFAVPEVKQFCIDECGLGIDGFVKRFSPRKISLSLRLVHIQAIHERIKATMGPADDGAIAAT